MLFYQVSCAFIHGVGRPEVIVVVLHAVADEAFGLLLLARWEEGADDKVQLRQNQNCLYRRFRLDIFRNVLKAHITKS